MKLIENPDQLIKNLETLENYLTEGDEIQMLEANLLIKRGTCFVAYKVDGELRFSPSRFIGYFNNNIERHQKSTSKHGGITNNAISKVLKSKPKNDDNLDIEYLRYCQKLAIIPSEKGSFGVKRKFWELNIINDFENNRNLTNEFPEGKIVERKHKSRERNKKLIEEVKTIYKNKFGELICQVCDFNFEKKYGEIGQDFIECHHTIAVSEMNENHKTRIEDIVILCANCHRMIHRKRPWLGIHELKNLLK